MNTLLVLDISTNSTGYAVFDISTKFLKSYGCIKPKVPGVHKLHYPSAVYRKIKSMSAQIKELVLQVRPDLIIIEEVNRGINRIGQKGLDACHFFVLDSLCEISEDWLSRVKYYDSNGKTGWRPALGMRLSDADKEHNKTVVKHNKKNKVKLAKVDWKVLAQRHVLAVYKLQFDVENNPGDNDICDAISLGDAWFKKFNK